MSVVLKFNGKYAHKLNGMYVRKLNDEWVQCGSHTLPKGSIIRVDLNGDLVKERYRVLDCTKTLSGTYCTIMSMSPFSNVRYYPYGEGVTQEFSDGVEGLKFTDSLVDKELDLFYNRLTYKVQQCLIPSHKSQEMWEYTYLGDTLTPSGEDCYYGTVDYDNDKYYKLTKKEGTLDLGTRKIYVPTLTNVIDYLGKEYGDTITYDEVYHLFFETYLPGDIKDSVWFMDASFRGSEEDNLNKNAMFFANRQYGNLANYHYTNVFEVRPVFTFDLLKLTDEYNIEIDIED